ncbi:hypothetical protein GQ53DRAFT_778746 [Thozetella sp. PMI_491]|nr:hypothetical protein GQ53DRAFT_778746 [Thozetella sp. PMI_491]
MSLAHARIRRQLPLASLVLIWCLRVFFVQDALYTILIPGHREEQAEASFLKEAMNVEFPAPIDYAPIREVCARTQFREGLLFTCEEQHGGIGMLRNQILKCIRYAIQGGGAIVVPSMALRNANDITDIETANEVPLDYLFDRQAFITRLSEGCPGMRIYDSVHDFPNYHQRSVEPLSLLGDQFEPGHPVAGLQHPNTWRRDFDQWLERQSIQVSAEDPLHIKLEQSFMEYPVHSDGVPFMNEFGKILSFRSDTRALAARVLFELKKRYGLPIDPSKAINPNAFYGAHLRLEKDAIWAWPPSEWRFSRQEEQFEQQYQNLVRTNLNVVYVASGEQPPVDAFAEDMNRRLAADPSTQGRNVTVLTKYDLLKGWDRRKLYEMTFDQQALVDFLVMFKASAFMGGAHSSFPWTVALRRHEVSRYSEYGNDGSDLLKDELSVIMGMAKDYPHVDPFVTGIWP